MKRSEMFKILIEALCKPIPYHDDGGIQMCWQVEHILTAMENSIIEEWEEEDESL